MVLVEERTHIPDQYKIDYNLTLFAPRKLAIILFGRKTKTPLTRTKFARDIWIQQGHVSWTKRMVRCVTTQNIRFVDLGLCMSFSAQVLWNFCLLSLLAACLYCYESPRNNFTILVGCRIEFLADCACMSPSLEVSLSGSWPTAYSNSWACFDCLRKSKG